MEQHVAEAIQVRACSVHRLFPRIRRQRRGWQRTRSCVDNFLSGEAAESQCLSFVFVLDRPGVVVARLMSQVI